MKPSNRDVGGLRNRLAGHLPASPWRAAFAEVPRHTFVPRFHRQGQDGQWRTVTQADDEYWEKVYADEALVTQLDEHGIPTSSSSQPLMMLWMLDALDAQPGHQVFELGTGTGYNAALLASRLGDSAVVSVDVDPALADVARSRLRQTGRRPFLRTGDGAMGWSPKAPYHRFIATAGVPCVPPAFLEQAHEDSIVVAPIGLAIARVVVYSATQAEGRFVEPAFFMQRRQPAEQPHFAAAEVAPAEQSEHDVHTLLHTIWLPLSFALPGYQSCSWRDDEGELTGIALWAADGSVATAHVDGVVRQSGPRRLWETVEKVANLFAEAPTATDFGITVSRGRQKVWYRSPDGPGWDLPTAL